MQYLRLFTVFLAATVTLFGQLYSGPAAGSVASGVLVNTLTFENASGGNEPNYSPKPMKNIFTNSKLADHKNVMPPAAPMGANYYVDPMLTRGHNPALGDFVLSKNFQGVPDQGFYIPPDPHMAVGPQHIVAVVNSRFRILDKTGTVLSTIEGSNWYSSVLSGADPFDPKVIYDQHAKRGGMVWPHLNAT